MHDEACGVIKSAATAHTAAFNRSHKSGMLDSTWLRQDKLVAPEAFAKCFASIALLCAQRTADLVFSTSALTA